MNILLTSAGRRTYLVDYFKEALVMAGFDGQVHVANSEVSPAFSAADRQVVTPLIYDCQYIPFLLEYCREWKIRLLVPLFDLDLPVLAARREEFASAGTIVVTADEEAVKVCNDKWKTYCLLTEKGINVPQSWLDTEAAVRAAREGIMAYPLIVKPRWGMGSLSVYQADDEEELRVFVRKIRREIEGCYLKYEAVQDRAVNVLIQEKVAGREFGLDVVNGLDGRYRKTVVKEKMAMRAGETDAAETVESPVLEEMGRRLAEILQHRGNLDVDIREAGGEYFVLELNARFGGGYPFSHAAGVNLPYALVMWAAGKEPEAQYLEARSGVRGRKDIRILTGDVIPREEG